MAIQVQDIQVVHRVVGSKHVLTSPDVPELHVSHAEEAVAYADLQGALDAIERIKNRIAARHAQNLLLEVA